jgi:glycosyltransferase involved in cell wall biosynthesis
MTILVDGRAFTAPAAGISNFLKDSIMAWEKSHPADTILVALPRPLHKTFSPKGLPDNVLILEKSNALFRLFPNLVWLLIMMPLLARRWKADIYYSPVPCLPFLLPRRMKKIIVVHDVVNIEFQKTMQWRNVLANKLLFRYSIMKTDIIWTNSHYTRQKVEQYFPKRLCQDIFTGASVNRTIYKSLTLTDEQRWQMMQKYQIDKDFILFVGSLEPRKNLNFLLSLMPELYRRKQLQMVVVGGSGWKNSSIRSIVEDKDFPRESTVFCGFVPNEDLVKLYHLARCFVSASLNEGFGMPQLEALLCGCPIVTAHNSAMIEMAEGKDGANTVEGYDQETWIQTIIHVAEERPKVNTAQLANYDWDIVLKKLLEKRL